MNPTDQQLLDQLARVFAEAALEQLLAELQTEQEHCHETSKANSRDDHQDPCETPKTNSLVMYRQRRVHEATDRSRDGQRVHGTTYPLRATRNASVTVPIVAIKGGVGGG